VIWNESGKEYSFTLLCAYVMDNFSTERDAGGFAQVCRTHSRVVPTERYLSLQDSDARLREVSALQQRARALESEVAHRKQVEKELREAVRVRDDFLCVAGHELRTPLTVLRLQLASLLANEGANQTPRTERRLAALAAQTERLSRLAEPTASFGGLGLGLWIARRVVDAHGGEIRVEDSPERKGATFIVTLPYALPD